MKRNSKQPARVTRSTVIDSNDKYKGAILQMKKLPIIIIYAIMNLCAVMLLYSLFFSVFIYNPEVKDYSNVTKANYIRKAQTKKAQLNSTASYIPYHLSKGVKYWRYDHVALEVLISKSYFLPSIPSSRRIPKDRVHTADEYLADIVSGKKEGMLFEYNPTLAQIPKSMFQYLDVQSDHIPAYLASFRVTARSSCFRRNVTDKMDWNYLDRIYKDNYLGLALLGADLIMIPGTDVVIDLNKQLGERNLEDFRLFTINQKLYLNMNPAPVKLIQISISTSSTYTFSESFKKVENLYGDGLFLTVHHALNTLHGQEFSDKNFALFQAKGHNNDEILAEIRPHDPHVIKKINPVNTSVLDCKMIKEANKDSRLCVGHSIHLRELSGEFIKDDTHTKPSFMNINDIMYDKEIMSNARGGACCVKIEDPRNRENGYLLAGAGHKKSIGRKPGLAIPKHEYFAYFYAFEPEPPYRPVARSGLFCFPFTKEDKEVENRNFPLVHKRKLYLRNEIFECPEITFVSSFVENTSDESKAIISYGINDCLPKIVEVDKAEIERLLFATNL